MSKPPHDDPNTDWDVDAATLVELLPNDIEEIRQEDRTPRIDLRTHPAFKLGVDAAIGAMDAILSAGATPVPRQKLDALCDMVRTKVYLSTV